MNTYCGVSVWQWQSNSDYLAHHGILGQKWGKGNGPPYPLSAGAHSSAEKRLKSKNEGKLESWKTKERSKGARDAEKDFNTYRAYRPSSRMDLPSDRAVFEYSKRHSDQGKTPYEKALAKRGGVKVSTEYAKGYEEKRKRILKELEAQGVRPYELKEIDKKTKALLNAAYSEPRKLNLKKLSSNIGKTLKTKVKNIKATLDRHPRIKAALKIAAIVAITAVVGYAASRVPGVIRARALEVLEKRMDYLMNRPFVKIGDDAEFYSKKIAELLSGELSATRSMIDTVKFGSTMDRILGSLLTLNKARHW